MLDVHLRKAGESDQHWINSAYQSIGFQISDCSNERIVLAEINGQPIGVGRLVKLSGVVAELGGIYVDPRHRRNKIAEKIVTELLRWSDDFSILYCLPFSYLKEFYKKFGFREIEAGEESQIPEQMTQKLAWCQCAYQQTTSILIKMN